MKTTRDYLNIIDAYHETGSYRAAGLLCGVTHKTVRRVVERHQSGGPWTRRPRLPTTRNTDPVLAVLAKRVKDTDGRISAKRLLPVARAAGYTGSARNLRRAVAKIKADHRQKRRLYRPWVPTPGQHLVIDWTPEAGMQIFCAVLAWSRYRFVRFAANQTRETTLALLAECFEELGAVPAVVLSDRMSCLKKGVVANVVVPHPDYVRFAAHYGFRPDFCESADPESKGVVENLAGYVQVDLVVPEDGFRGKPEVANRQARVWGVEVNGRVHSEIHALPAERLKEERPLMRPLPSLRPPLCRGELRKVDRLQTIRFGSARYSVSTTWVGRTLEVMVRDGEVVIGLDGNEIACHQLQPPGGISIHDHHYSGPARPPARAIRVRTETERAFIALGPVAEGFLRSAAAVGTSRLAGELAEIVSMEPSWGREQLVAALERATRFRRFKAEDLRDILAAGPQAPNPVPAGKTLQLLLPEAPVRSLQAYALEAIQ